METFLEHTDFLTEKQTNQKNVATGNLCLRCCRKKFKCIILWFMSVIVITQLLVIIFDKLDEKFINSISEHMFKFLNKNYNNSTLN